MNLNYSTEHYLNRFMCVSNDVYETSSSTGNGERGILRTRSDLQRSLTIKKSSK